MGGPTATRDVTGKKVLSGLTRRHFRRPISVRCDPGLAVQVQKERAAVSHQARSGERTPQGREGGVRSDQRQLAGHGGQIRKEKKGH